MSWYETDGTIMGVNGGGTNLTRTNSTNSTSTSSSNPLANAANKPTAFVDLADGTKNALPAETKHVLTEDPEEPDFDSSGGGGGGGGGGDDEEEGVIVRPTEDDDTALKRLLNTEAASQKTADLIKDLDPATIDRINNIDTKEYEDLLSQVKAAQEQQAINTIDYGTNNSITELQRTEQDAQDDFQTQRAQIDAEMKRALDNQVLYNRARGDNGGIGAEQYNSIQNTAAVNQLTVNKEQTKLATDTQRQIADLRAQGEYTKADQLLSISQNYLSQLMSLKQWAQETNVGIDEFNAQLAEWEANYKISLIDAEITAANATGAFSDGTATASVWSNVMSQMANAGNALLQAGVIPSNQQLEAMGTTADQAQAFAEYLKRMGKLTKS